MRRLLAALASCMFVAAVVAVAAPPRATALDGDQRIVVHPDEDSVVAEGMAPGAAITITRGDPPAVIAEGLLEMTDEGDVRFQSPEDIQAGDVVTVKDGSVTRIHAVTAVAVGAISGNTVTGNATPGLVDFWLNGADPGVNRQVTSMDGTWSINVGEPGNEDWEQGLAELGPGASGAVEQKDDDGDSTHVDWRIPNPWVTASVGDTGISGNDFVPGAIVTVSLNDAVIGAATVEAWSDFTLESTRALEVGDRILATPSEGVAKELVVSGVSILEIANNVVSGTGAMGTYIDLGVSTDDAELHRHVTILSSGAWSEDVGNPGDEAWETQTAMLGRGSGGTILDVDADGDATRLDWHIANPQVVADLTDNRVGGSEFGGPVTIRIDGPGGASHTWTEGIEYGDEGFGLWLDAGPDAEAPWTLGAGQTITVTGPNGEASLAVADLQVEGWDDATNKVWGTTDQSGPVVAEAMHADKEDDSFQVDKPLPEWEIGLADIRIMDAGRVWQFDPEGDLTQLRLTFGPTRFLFSPLFQQIVGSDWVDGSTVTLTIDPQAQGAPDYTATSTAGPLDCNARGACPAWQVPLTGHVNVFFDLSDTGFQARAGDVITMTDGTTKKTLTAPALRVDLPDLDAERVTGLTTSPMPGFLTVGTRIEDECDSAHDVMPEDLGAGGSWAVAFGEECRVRPGSVMATETDEDGDQTWTTDPVVDLRVEPAMDRVWAAWWAGSNVALTIERDGSPVFTRTVVPQNVLTRGSWNLDMWTRPIGTLDAPMMALFDLSGVGGFDIRAGDVLRVTDGAVTRTITVANLAVTGVNAATDTVTGTAAPGQQVGFHLWDGEEGYWGYETTAGADGNWTFAFETGPGAFPGQGLDPGMSGQAFGPDTTTVIRWTVPTGIATSTAIIADAPDPSVVGQAYLVAVKVTRTGADNGRPLGTVIITDGRGASCTDTTSSKVDGWRSAFSCSLRSTAAGAMTLTATFNPATGWAGSTGTAAHRVKRAATTTEITNAATLAKTVTKAGERYPVAVKVTVSRPGSGTPVGPVTVSDGSATCAIVALSAVGTGSCQLTSTSAGTMTITARYDGTPDYGASKDTAVHRVTRR